MLLYYPKLTQRLIDGWCSQGCQYCNTGVYDLHSAGAGDDDLRCLEWAPCNSAGALKMSVDAGASSSHILETRWCKLVTASTPKAQVPTSVPKPWMTVLLMYPEALTGD